MRIDSPSHVLKLHHLARFAGGNDAALHLKVRTEQRRFLHDLRDLEPTAEEVEEAAEFLTSVSGILIPPDWFAGVLHLYPNARIRLAAFRSASDCEVRESLVFCLAHFLLGCRWPTLDESALLPQFLALLQEQAEPFGLQRWRPTEVVPFMTGFPGQAEGRKGTRRRSTLRQAAIAERHPPVSPGWCLVPTESAAGYPGRPL
jgi:hypothetical protein